MGNLNIMITQTLLSHSEFLRAVPCRGIRSLCGLLTLTGLACSVWASDRQASFLPSKPSRGCIRRALTKGTCVLNWHTQLDYVEFKLNLTGFAKKKEEEKEERKEKEKKGEEEEKKRKERGKKRK